MTKLEGEDMRIYNYKNKWEQFLTPEIVSMLTQIHEFKGKQNYFNGSIALVTEDFDGCICSNAIKNQLRSK